MPGEIRRHQVGRELDAAELHAQRLRQRANQQRLAQAGHAFEQHVAAREQRDQGLAYDLVLSDDGLADSGFQFLADGANLFRIDAGRRRFVLDAHLPYLIPSILLKRRVRSPHPETSLSAKARRSTTLP